MGGKVQIEDSLIYQIKLTRTYYDYTYEHYKKARWITPEEGVVLSSLVKSHNINTVVESGTANGYSTVWFSTVCENIHTWDIVDRPKVWDNPDLPFTQLKACITFNESDMAEHTVSVKGPTLYFFDGDHSRQGIRDCWNAVSLLVNTGDIIMVHDFGTERGVEAGFKDIWESVNAKREAYIIEYDTPHPMAGIFL